MDRTAANPTLDRVKTLLWGVMGVWSVVTVARFANGLGATSGLTDVAPWGFWIAFDVMAGVALAAGGFVIAAAVYIFGLKQYHRFARPAILTALLGYIAVAVGLLYDLGLPWHIWHPMIMPQHHSVLFEVAMCVMLYLTVLTLEFSPAVLEHPLFHRPLFLKLLAVIKKLTVPLVIAGIVLSTLHQSSLGSLFLIQPFRLHPLWYSPIMHLLFLISAVGLGLMMVTLESLVSAWLFGHEVRNDLLAGLARVASAVLSVYVVLRLGDLFYRGVLPGAIDGSFLAGWFVFELAISAIIPATLLAFRRVRTSVAGLWTCSIMTVTGTVLYRFDTCIVAFARPEGMPYLPTWIELAVSIGIVSGACSCSSSSMRTCESWITNRRRPLLQSRRERTQPRPSRRQARSLAAARSGDTHSRSCSRRPRHSDSFPSRPSSVRRRIRRPFTSRARWRHWPSMAPAPCTVSSTWHRPAAPSPRPPTPCRSGSA